MRRAAALLLGAALLAAPCAAASAPARVVSVNLCADQLAMLLAAPGQLVSVSHIAHDPLASSMIEEALEYPANHGGAEEVWLLRPDLVLAGEFTPEPTVAMLRRVGVEVVRLPIVRSLDRIAPQILAVGRALGREAEAAREAAVFEARLASLRDEALTERPRAALWHANGWSLGAGTLSADILEAGGFANLAAEFGLEGGGTLPLEALVMAAPDLVLSGGVYPGASEGEAMLRHPALGRFHRARIEDRDWVCGAPAVVRAIEALRAERRATGETR